MRWFLVFFWLFFICGCSESNGVDYMAPSPQNGFSTNKQVFAAKYSTSSKEWSAKQGALFTVPITVKNVSASAWSSHTEEHSVQMSYHWLDLKKNMLTFEGLRTSFPKTIVPGAQHTVDLRVEAPAQLGRYILQVTMIKNGVDWFERQYVTPLELILNID